MKQLTGFGDSRSSIPRFLSCSRSVSSNLKPVAIGAPWERSARSLLLFSPRCDGFPLTLYLLSGWLQSRYPGVDWFSHYAGHLLEMLLGWRTNPHWGPFHLLSFALIGGGFLLIAAGWQVLYEAQRTQRLATQGPYAYVRHPQYAGFVLVLVGFLVQWPTILTLAMFPLLLIMYIRLARQEECEAETAFGQDYVRYADRVPAFLPLWTRLFGESIAR